MTISSSTRKAGPFTGNGVTTAYPFAFKVFSASDLLVVLALTSTGAETVQTITTNYTVELNADQSTNPGGAVTMLVAPAAGYTLTLTSQVANLQPTDLTNAGGFYPKVINDALDRATIQIQQLAEKAGRALQVSVSTVANIVLPAPSAGTLLGWDATGSNLINIIAQTGTSLVNLASSAGSSLVGFIQSGTGAVARTVQDKARESVSVSDYGDVTTWLSSGVNTAKVTSLIPITINTHIDSTKTLEFTNGGGFSIATGVTLTIEAEIIAGDHQIFFCTGTGSVVATDNNMGSGFYKIRTPIVKAIWFGVIPDALMPNSASTGAAYASGTVPIGTVPTGTDSSAALRMAVQYVQLTALKSAAWIYALTNPILSLPSGQVLVKGNNLMGNQYQASVMAGYYATADSGGDAATPSAAYRQNSYNFHVEGNDCTFLWVVQASTDKFWDSGFLVNYLVAKNFTVSPILSANGCGIFFYNKGLCSYGSTNNYANNLGPATFDNVNVTMTIINGYSSNSELTYRLRATFLNEGYARCDNITVRNGHYNGFNVFWSNQNPEATVLRFENNMFGMHSDSCICFQFLSFFGGFKASGNYFEIKNNNQKILQEVYLASGLYIGASQFANSTYDFKENNRYEFTDGLTNFIMFTGYQGRGEFDGYDVGFGTTSRISTGWDAVIDGTASCEFKNCAVIGSFQITGAATALAKGYPRVAYDNCANVVNSFMGTECTWGGGAYKGISCSNAGNLPHVQFKNTQASGTSLPYPEFYGLQVGHLSRRTEKVSVRVSAYDVIGTGAYFDLPPFIKITSIKIFNGGFSTANFTDLRVTIGDGTLGTGLAITTTLSGVGAAQAGLEMLAANTCVIVPSYLPAWRKLKTEMVKAGSVVAFNNYGWLEITYEAATTYKDLFPSYSTDVAVIQAII